MQLLLHLSLSHSSALKLLFAHFLYVCVQHGPRAWCLESCLVCPGPARLWIRRKHWRLAGWRDSGASWKTGSCVGLSWGLKRCISTRIRMKPRHRWHSQNNTYWVHIQHDQLLSPCCVFELILVWSLINIQASWIYVISIFPWGHPMCVLQLWK